MKAKAWVCCLIVAMAMVLSGTAKAQVSTNCGHTDPNNFDQVYACMSSAHYGNETGPNFFAAGLLNTPCQSLAMKYAAVMQRAGASREEAIELVPSCQMIAKVAQAMAGKPPFWGACTDYPGHFDPEHMKACLTGYLAGYRRMTLDRLAGCQDAVGQYEQALQTATIVKARTINRGLPEGYSRPSCEQVVAVIGNKGGQCANYAPTVEHVRQCLATAADRISDCLTLRQSYETKLRQAYGGVFPPGYTPLTCQQLDPILAEVKRKQEKARQDAIEAARRRHEEEEGRRYAAFHNPIQWGSFGGLGDWFKIGMLGLGGGWAAFAVGLLGVPFWLSFIVHALIEAWNLITWRPAPLPAKAQGVVDILLRTLGLKTILSHGTAFSAGTWFLGLMWIPGAVLAIVIGRFIAFLLWTRKAFKRRAGPAEE